MKCGIWEEKIGREGYGLVEDLERVREEEEKDLRGGDVKEGVGGLKGERKRV